MAESVKIAAMADAYEVNVAPHNFYGHLATMMNAHFCAVVPNLRIMEIDPDTVPWYDDLVTVKPDDPGRPPASADRPGVGDRGQRGGRARAPAPPALTGEGRARDVGDGRRFASGRSVRYSPARGTTNTEGPPGPGVVRRKGTRVTTWPVIGIVGAVVAGLLGGFLWWGMPNQQRDADLRDARGSVERLERQVDEGQARIKAIEKELEAERQRRAQLEMALSQGKIDEAARASVRPPANLTGRIRR